MIAVLVQVELLTAPLVPQSGDSNATDRYIRHF